MAPSSIRGLAITGKNVRYENDGGHFTVTSIMLDEITSCAAAKRSHEVFLALAIIIFVGGIILAMYAPDDSGFYLAAGSGISLAMVLLFLVTRRTNLEFCSRGGAKIALSTGTMSPGEIIGIIDRIETAKESFVKSLASGSTVNRPAARQAAPPPPVASAAPPVEIKPENAFWIAQNGQEEGPFEVSEIRARLSGGILTPQDYFLDPAINDWVSLDRLPNLA